MKFKGSVFIRINKLYKLSFVGIFSGKFVFSKMF